MIRLGLAVESMANHSTDEGAQIFKGLSLSGYTLAGYNFPESETDVPRLLLKYNPNVVVIQDKREWAPTKLDFRDPNAKFINHEYLKHYDGLKLTILKDAHQKPDWHKQAAEEMGIDYHIVYYDEDIVRYHAPWVGNKTIRTWHTIDKDIIPPYKDRERTCILSGAISGAYPLRRRLAESRFEIPEMDYLPHPGYHRKFCHTPYYLEILSQYRVSICTCSKYNYALRKIMESTAAGCRVITNLPSQYSPPGIEANLFRIDDDTTISQLRDIIMVLSKYYDPQHQQAMAQKCMELYDYRVVTKKLADDIDYLANRDPKQ